MRDVRDAPYCQVPCRNTKAPKLKPQVLHHPRIKHMFSTGPPSSGGNHACQAQERRGEAELVDLAVLVRVWE